MSPLNLRFSLSYPIFVVEVNLFYQAVSRQQSAVRVVVSSQLSVFRILTKQNAPEIHLVRVIGTAVSMASM